MDIDNAFELVRVELEKASSKFPEWPIDPLHAVAVIGEELGELNQAILQRTYEPDRYEFGSLKTEAIQVAAMAMRFLVSVDHYHSDRSKQMFDNLQ